MPLEVCVVTLILFNGRVLHCNSCLSCNLFHLASGGSLEHALQTRSLVSSALSPQRWLVELSEAGVRDQIVCVTVNLREVSRLLHNCHGNGVSPGR